MDDPAAGTVVDARGLFPGRNEGFEVIDKGKVEFGEIADFGGPIVHLDVDVEVIIAVPGSLEMLVPEALEVRRQGAGARASHQKVASELKVKGRELRIRRPIPQRGQALVGGQGRGGARAEAQSDPAEVMLVVRHVGHEQLPERNSARDFEWNRAAHGRVGGDVVWTAVTGGGRQEQGDGIGAIDAEAGVGGVDLAAFRQRQEVGLE